MQLRKDRVHYHGRTNKDEKYICYKCRLLIKN